MTHKPAQHNILRWTTLVSVSILKVLMSTDQWGPAIFSNFRLKQSKRRIPLLNVNSAQ